MDSDSQKFIVSLQNNDLHGVRHIPKSDLHNHAGRGGSQCYIANWANVKIDPPDELFSSLDDMQVWFEQHVKIHCPGIAGYLKRLEAAFAQAKADNIKVLALNFGLDEVKGLGGMEHFVKTIHALHTAFAPETEFLPELSLNRACNTDRIYNDVEEALSYRWFASIDICCNELAQPIEPFHKIYRLAQSLGVKRKAHVGEFGTADDVIEACELLELDEVHHGIAAAASVPAMRWLSKHKIQLNVCPTSNILLGRAKSYQEHPIRALHDHDVKVTINTDDLLIFNQSASQEYQNLYSAGCMTGYELDSIRLTGLSASQSYQPMHRAVFCTKEYPNGLERAIPKDSKA